jgi:RNA polymerase sigma-70 factor (ECF subfamily)
MNDEFSQVCRENWPVVTRCVAGQVRSGDGHVVDDLVQVAFVRAWKAWPPRDASVPAAVRSWLRTIATRAVCDHYRSAAGRRGGVEVPVDPTGPVWSHPAVGQPDHADQVCLRVDTAASMEAASPEARRAVLLRGQGRSWAQAATEMHHGTNVVRRLVAEAVGS